MTAKTISVKLAWKETTTDNTGQELVEYPSNAPLPREGELVWCRYRFRIVNNVVHKFEDGVLNIEIVMV